MEYEYKKSTIRFSVFLDADSNNLVDGLILYKSFFKEKILDSFVIRKEGDKFVIQGKPGQTILKYNEQVYRNVYDLEVVEDKYLKELNFNSMDTYLIEGLNELIEDFLNSEIVPASYLKVSGASLGVLKSIRNKYKLREKLEE